MLAEIITDSVPELEVLLVHVCTAAPEAKEGPGISVVVSRRLSGLLYFRVFYPRNYETSSR